MIFVGALLCAVAVADITRSQVPIARRAQPRLALLVGMLCLVVIALLAGLLTSWDLARVALAALVTAGWVLTSGEPVRKHLRPVVPLTILVAGIITLVVIGSGSPEEPRWIDQWLEGAFWSGGLSSDVLVLLLGLFLVQTSTANVVVRLVLTHVGALKPTGAPQASDTLRGGRLLGPMERIIILGLGLAGEVTAASLVIAAKGLIRWPELQSTRAHHSDNPGIDEVTEYFLVGSMVSWLVALVALAIATLALPW